MLTSLEVARKSGRDARAPRPDNVPPSKASPARPVAHGWCAAPAWPVSISFANLDAGIAVDEVMGQFDVTGEQVHAVLEFVARGLDKTP